MIFIFIYYFYFYSCLLFSMHLLKCTSKPLIAHSAFIKFLVASDDRTARQIAEKRQATECESVVRGEANPWWGSRSEGESQKAF